MRQLEPIQILRGLAALLVVFGHVQHDSAVTSLKLGNAFEQSFLLPWGAGVDLFFVISGFIMVYASQDLFGRPGAARLFLTRRIIRIVPLYWIFASAYLLLQVLLLRLEGKPMAGWGDVVASYLFFPSDTFADGFARPFYTLGWTLNYEMFFYVCFAAVLMFPRMLASLGVIALLGFGVVAGALFSPESIALSFWSSPIVLEFALGAIIALMLLEDVTLSKPLCVALFGAAGALLLRDHMNADLQSLDWITPNSFRRVLSWGLPAAMIVAACVLAESDEKSRLLAPLGGIGKALGDASYALYLIHPFVIVLTRKAALASGMLVKFGPWPVLALTIVLSCLAALAVHALLEKPMIAWLRARFEQGRPQFSLRPA